MSRRRRRHNLVITLTSRDIEVHWDTLYSLMRTFEFLRTCAIAQELREILTRVSRDFLVWWIWRRRV